MDLAPSNQSSDTYYVELPAELFEAMCFAHWGKTERSPSLLTPASPMVKVPYPLFLKLAPSYYGNEGSLTDQEASILEELKQQTGAQGRALEVGVGELVLDEWLPRGIAAQQDGNSDTETAEE